MGEKNINKFIIRVLVEAGSHGRDLSDGDLPKYPRIKRTRRIKAGDDAALLLAQQAGHYDLLSLRDRPITKQFNSERIRSCIPDVVGVAATLHFRLKTTNN